MKAHELFTSSVSADERLACVRSFDIDRLWMVLLAEHVQETVVKAACSRLNRLIKKVRYLSMTFEDYGQDFLTWTLDKKGKVIYSDAQAFFWVGGHVTDYRSLIPGTYPLFQPKGKTDLHAIKYPLKKVHYYAGSRP